MDPSLADTVVDAFAQQVGLPAVPGVPGEQGRRWPSTITA
jgi:hypothetical protein